VSYKRKENVDIASSGTVSDYVKLEGEEIVGIYCPAALTGTTFTFLTKFEDGDTAVPVVGVTITHANSSYVPLTQEQTHALLGCRRLALVVSSQLAARVVGLAIRGLY
jgi:hypothetical protein